MRQRQRLGQILVEPERAGQRARDLLHFQGMRQPGAVMIALVEHEDLGLVLQAAEGGRMDDAVAIAPEIVAAGARRLRHEPPPAQGRVGGKGRARGGLDRHIGPCLRWRSAGRKAPARTRPRTLDWPGAAN